jgi:hypothetical protein
VNLLLLVNMTCLHLVSSLRQLISQDVGVNRFSDIGADIGSALGRAAITGDVEGELQAAATGVASREVADLLRNAFATSTGSDEVIKQKRRLLPNLKLTLRLRSRFS